MMPDNFNNPDSPGGEPSAPNTGNASNPTPHNANRQPADENQLLGKGAEKYLREVSSIEDLPDPQDQQDMDDLIEEEKGK